MRARTGLAAGLLLAGAATALPAAAQQRSGDLTVNGRRLPAAEAPRSATCEYLSRDTIFSAWRSFGDGHPLMGPRIYLPTRMPRNPDYAAAPKVAPGSPLPQPTGRRFGTPDLAIDQASTPQPSDTALAQAAPAGSPLQTPGAQTVIEAAVAACRAQYQRGVFIAAPRSQFYADAVERGTATNDAIQARLDARYLQSRAEIAFYDRTLPTAFLLFDQGRYAESLDWFRKAAGKLQFREGGDEAMLFTGKLYLQALGPRCDPVEAVKWLKKAATAPFDSTAEMPIFDPRAPALNTAVGEAAVILGNLYRTGYPGIPKDPEESRRWYERAYSVGHVAAAKMLGDIYLSGLDTPRDVGKAESWYRKGAKLDLPAAQVALADMLWAGEGPVKRDRREALGWYHAAARSENPAALYALARAYDRGEGVAADPVLALGFYKSAALAGDAAAKTALGTYFYEGRQVAADRAVARGWFRAAAEARDADGMFDLAAMMVRGEGGPRDTVEAWGWMKRAAALGQDAAPAALSRIEAAMTPDERQAAEARLRAS